MKKVADDLAIHARRELEGVPTDASFTCQSSAPKTSLNVRSRQGWAAISRSVGRTQW